MALRDHKLLFSAWLVCFAVGVACAAIFLYGIFRDQRVGEPVIVVDFGQTSDWRSDPFRVWGAGQYKLFLSSVNHDPARVGAPLAAQFEIVITAGGRTYFRHAYAAGATGHVLPDNYGDTPLGSFDVDGSPFETWQLQARVLAPDASFRGVRSQIRFRKQRYDPGMGGLINYVMIIPAGFFLLLAFVAAVALARKGVRVPVWLTSISGVLFLVVMGW